MSVYFTKHRLRIVTIAAIFIAAGAATANEPAPLDELLLSEQIGPVIAEGAGFTVHLKEANTGSLRCPDALRSEKLSAEQRESRRLRILNEMSDIQRADKLQKGARIERYYYELFPEYNRRHDAGEITKSELDALVLAGEKEASAIDQEPLNPTDQARMDALQAEKNRNAQNVTFFLRHRPPSPGSTILPMKGNQPAATFVGELSKLVVPLLEDCGEVSTIHSVHHYAEVRNSAVPADWGVITLEYRIENGALHYQSPRIKSTGNAATDARLSEMSGNFDRRDPAQNRELTLAGFRGVQAELHARAADVARQRAIAAATYRRAHATANGRQPGIVYLLDEHWYRYEDLDYARRIFDGDFARAKEAEFPLYFNALADVYSAACTEFIEHYKSYDIGGDAYAGSSWNMDGSRTIEMQRVTREMRIAARFSPEWGDYYRDANFVLMQRMAERMSDSNAGDLMYMSVREFLEALRGVRAKTFVEHEDYVRFIRHHQCESSAVEQLVQNFERAADGRRSLQDDGVLLPHAADESDPVVGAADPRPAVSYRHEQLLPEIGSIK